MRATFDCLLFLQVIKEGNLAEAIKLAQNTLSLYATPRQLKVDKNILQPQKPVEIAVSLKGKVSYLSV